jgi:hypothetical protein
VASSCILVFPSSSRAGQRTSAIRFLRTSKLPLVIVLMGVACLQLPAQAPSTTLATPNSQDVIAFLNQNIDWYRHLAIEEGIATDPSDILFVNDNRDRASQIVRLSFDFARAAAQIANAQAPSQTNPTPASSRFQNVIRIAAQTDQLVRETQTEIDQIRNQVQNARPAQRQKLQATLEELQSELALAQARSEALHNIIQFTNIGSGGWRRCNSFSGPCPKSRSRAPLVRRQTVSRSPAPRPLRLLAVQRLPTHTASNLQACSR